MALVKKPKKTVVFLLVLVFILNINSFVFAADTKYIKDSPVSQNIIGEAEITGKIPILRGFSDRNLEKDLNEKIEAVYKKEVAAVEDSFAKITFTYAVKQFNSIVSILMYITVDSDIEKEKVISFNYDSDICKIIWLDDPNIFGINAVKIANKAVSAKINALPAKFNTNFSSISPSQSFYMENNEVVILFDESEIAPAYEGIKAIPIPLRSVKHFTINSDEYAVKKDHYNLKMIPLKYVVSNFGYTLNWNPSTKDIYIYKNNQYVARITVAQNQYFKGQAAKRQLEVAPEIIRDDRTYVPISFFEEILDIQFSVDYGDKLTFSQYTPGSELLR